MWVLPHAHLHQALEHVDAEALAVAVLLVQVHLVEQTFEEEGQTRVVKTCCRRCKQIYLRHVHTDMLPVASVVHIDIDQTSERCVATDILLVVLLLGPLAHAHGGQHQQHEHEHGLVEHFVVWW